MFLVNPARKGRWVARRITFGAPPTALCGRGSPDKPRPRIPIMARINIFGKAENRLRPVWQAAVPDHAIAIAWSPDSSRLAVAAVSGPITIFDANSGKPVHQLKGHGFGTAALAWQPTGSLLASVGQDSKVRVWEVPSARPEGVATAGQEARALDAGASWAEKVVWHPSGQYLATAAGKKARVWT